MISTSAATPLTYINQVNPIYVNFSIPATTMTQLRILANEGKVTAAEELSSTVYTGDDTKYPETGKVIFFDKVITSATGDIKIKAEFPNPYMALLPGQYVRATLDGYTLTNAIVIPQKSIIQRQGKQFVLVIDGQNRAHFTPVELGINMGNYFMVLDGLKAGDKIVVEGTNKVMRDNALVMDAKTMQSKAGQAPQQQAK